MSQPAPPGGRVFGVQKGNRRFFSSDDDQVLRQLKSVTPELSWTQIADSMPGFRARQLRERWCNYLSPNLNTANWTEEDDRRLMELYTDMGPKWGLIGAAMGNRAPPDIKNRFQLIHSRRQREIKAEQRRRRRAAKRSKVPSVNAPNYGDIEPKKEDNSDVHSGDIIGTGRDPTPVIENSGTAHRNDSEQNQRQGPIDFSIRNLLV
jgi:hypothetical protein